MRQPALVHIKSSTTHVPDAPVTHDPIDLENAPTSFHVVEKSDRCLMCLHQASQQHIKWGCGEHMERPVVNSSLKYLPFDTLCEQTMAKYILWARSGPAIYCRYCVSDVLWHGSFQGSNWSKLPSYHQTNSASKSPCAAYMSRSDSSSKGSGTAEAYTFGTIRGPANWIIFTFGE